MAKKLPPITDFEKWSSKLSIELIGKMAERKRSGYDPRKAIDAIVNRVLYGTYYIDDEKEIISSFKKIVRNYPEVKEYLDKKIANEIEFEAGKYKGHKHVLLIYSAIDVLGKGCRNILKKMEIEAPRIYGKIRNRVNPIEYSKEQISKIRGSSTKLPNKKFKLENTLDKLVKEIHG